MDVGEEPVTFWRIYHRLFVMKKAGAKDYYGYSLEKHKWINKKGITLSETEHDVLTLSAQGYTMNDIADRLCKSVGTIKACKRVLFSKLGVGSVTEALSYATNYKLLQEWASTFSILSISPSSSAEKLMLRML